MNMISIFLWLRLLQPVSAVDPVSWHFAYERLNNHDASLVIRACVDKKFYLGHSHPGGRFEAQIAFESNEALLFIGKCELVKQSSEPSQQVYEYRQLVRYSQADYTQLNATVRYQLCDKRPCAKERKLRITFPFEW